MSSTVPADLPRMFRPEAKLAAVPVQPTAQTRETLTAAPPTRTWSFLDRTTGKMQEVTCLQGCTDDHALDRETPSHPDDIWCVTAETTDVWLPVTTGGKKAVSDRVLSGLIRQEPFNTDLARRVPHALVEILEDSYIEPLDPDGLATVILALEGQLKQLRDMHAQLTELREQGRVQL